MNWISDFVRPKIKKTTSKEIADNLWTKCPECGQMLFNKELEKDYFICSFCGHHLRLPVKIRLEMLMDSGKYKLLNLPKLRDDPLDFKDSKKYSDRLRAYRKASQNDDAVIVAVGEIGGVKAVAVFLDFSFMGGSMGTVVGEGIVKAAEFAAKTSSPLVIVSASGGARMQEGILSLMQMARTTAAINILKEKGLPYISVLTDPTTGGVSASFAMLGDIHIAEKGAIIGFAGARVIEQTIRETLPEGFQKAEYLQEHGMVDIVVSRTELKDKISKVLKLLLNKKS
ncbi:MAG: acetyl-CoA carboxylase, carboxyltransferase subunit beta [bacterium]|nr:acetyl-CoA carboxylase, carboxyltransferase subunit beta [bacterium]MDY2830440.1 acetyl-CoA carboxylase, carboxyltransferase subunit beta [Alphaproteobacteria bacterium]